MTAVHGPAVPEPVEMVGLQGSGESTWVREHLAGTHEVVSKDHWPNARRREARQGRGRVPDVGVLATRKRFLPPSVGEGFDRVGVVRATLTTGGAPPP